MPIARFQMPDGRIARFEVPEGTTPEQAQVMMEQAMSGMQPQAAPTPKKGLGAAFGQGLESMLSSGQTSLEALTGDPNEVAAAALRRSEERSGKYAEQTGLDLLKKVYEEKGLLGGAKEVVRQVPLAIAEQAPNLAAMFGGARLGAMAGSAVAPGVGTVIGGVGGALVPSAMQAFGGDVERREAEGLPADFGISAAATVPQAALDVAGTLIPFGGKLVTKLTGIPMGAFFSKSAAQAEKIANERLLTTLAKGTATGMAAEIPTEIAQQMLERAQAGLSLSSPDAMEEYGRTAYQVGLLGPLGAVGRVSEKMGAQEDILQRQKDAQAATFAELAKTPEPTPVPAEIAPVVEAEPLPTALAPLAPKTAPTAPAELAPTAEPVYTPPAGDLPSLMDQHRTMSLQLDPFETQLQAAATKGDTAAITALLPQYEALQTQVQQLGAHIEKLGGTTVDAATFETTAASTLADYDKEIAAAQKKLANAGTLGDFKALPKLGTKLDTLKAEQAKLTTDFEAKRGVLAEQQKGLTQRGETRPLFTEAEAPEPTREQQQKYAESRGEVFAEKPEQAATTEVITAPEKETAPADMYDLFGDFNLLNTAINDRNPQVLANMHRARQRADQKALEARQPKRTPREQVAELLGPQIGKIIRRERNYDVREIETGERKGQEVFVSDDIAAAIMALRNTVEKPVGNAKRSLLQQLHDEFDSLEKRDDALQAAVDAGASEVKLATLRNQVATAQTRYEKKLARIAPYRAKLNAQLAKLYKETEIQTPRQKEAELQALGTSARVLSREAKRAKKSTKAELGLKAQAELDAVLDDVVREVGYKTEEYQKLVGPTQKKLNDKVEQLKKFVDTSVAKLETLKAEKGEDSKKYNTAVTNFIKQKKDRTQVVDAFAKSVAADLEAKARAIGAASPALAEAQEKAKKEFAKREKPVTAAQEPVYQRGTQATRNINKLSEIRTESPESRAETARGQERFESGLSEQKGSAYDYAQRQEALERTRKSREAKATKGTAMQVAMTKAAQDKVLKEVSAREEEGKFARGVEIESPDLTTEQIKMLEANDLRGAMRSIMNAPDTTPIYKAVIEAMLPILDATNVKLYDKLYDPQGKKVLGEAVSKMVKLSRDGGLSQEVLLHEATHAAVERVIQMGEADINLLTKEQQAAFKELKAIHAQVKRDANITSTNAKSSLSEFAAELFSNRNLHEQLRKKPWRISNMLDAIRSVVLRLLGVKQPQSMLGTGLKAVEALMMPTSMRPVIAEKPVSRKYSAKDIAALHTGSNSMRQFAEQFGPEIKQKDRTPEDVDRIALEHLYRMEMEPQDFVEFVEYKKLDYKAQATMSDGTLYDADNLKHFAEADTGIVAASEALNDPDLQKEEAREITNGRRKALSDLAGYLSTSPDYTLAEMALVAKAASKYGVISDKTGRLKMVNLSDNNRHSVAIVGRESANAVIVELRKGSSLKDAFLTGLQELADTNAKENRGKNGWQKFEQSSNYDAAVALNAGAAGTPWCTGYEVSKAAEQISKGDFYIYYKEGRPEVAVRMNGTDNIGEIRGNSTDQGLNKEQQTIAKQFLQTNKFKRADKFIEETERKETLMRLVSNPEDMRVEEFESLDIDLGAQDTKIHEYSLDKMLSFGTLFGYMPHNPSDKVKKELEQLLIKQITKKYADGYWLYSAIDDAPGDTADTIKEVEVLGKRYTLPLNKIKALDKIGISSETPDFAYDSLEYVKDFYVHTKNNTVFPRIKNIGTLYVFGRTNGNAVLNLPDGALINNVASALGTITKIVINGKIKINNVRTLDTSGGMIDVYAPEAEYVMVKTQTLEDAAKIIALTYGTLIRKKLVENGVSAEVMYHPAKYGFPGLVLPSNVRARKIIIEFYDRLQNVFGKKDIGEAMSKTKQDETAAVLNDVINMLVKKQGTLTNVYALADKQKAAFDDFAGEFRNNPFPKGEGRVYAPNIINPSDAAFTQITESPRYARTDDSVGVHKTKDGFGFRAQTEPVTVASSFVASKPSFKDEFMGNVLGLNGRVQFIDQHAALSAAFKQGVAADQISSLEAEQAEFYLRFSQQTSQFAGQALTNGPVELRKAEGGGHIYASKPGANMVQVAEAVSKANVGNDTQTEAMFTAYLAGMRADVVGWEKLSFDNPKLAQKEYNDVLNILKTDKQAADAFKEAADIYQQYNNGQLDLLVQTGYLSEKLAADLKKTPYVPFYRTNRSGNVELVIDKEHIVTLSNIKDEPQLKALVGDNTQIQPVFTSAVQNTFMITNMALRNQMMKDSSFLLKKMGIASAIGKSTQSRVTNQKEIDDAALKGVTVEPKYKDVDVTPVGPDVVRFKVKGEDHFVLIDTDMYGIPADLIVKGMEGIKTTLPAVFKLMGIPADVLRKFVTRNPAYAVKQAFRDPLTAWMTTGTDGVPVLNAFKELSKMVAGRSEEQVKLMASGAISSNVFSGDERDMSKFLKDLSVGKMGYHKIMAKLDAFAIQGDAATRAVVYKDSLNKGMSEMQALLRTLESMNFSRRGLTPSMQVLSTIIPFFNAQIQGLDVLYRAFTGQMPHSEQLKIRQKMLVRGLMLAAGTMAYAAMMQDDEAYKRAKPEERLANWFVYIPGVDEPMRVPIPFELGYLFKALPEAIFNMAADDERSSDITKGMGTLIGLSNPFALPQAIKPLTEVVLGRSFFSGDIESAREQQTMLPTERYRDSTTEFAKLLGSATGDVGLTPIKIDYLMRGYMGGLGLALVSLANPILNMEGKAEVADPTKKISKMPFIGGMFQPIEGRGTLDAAYERMQEIQQMKGSFNKLIEEGKKDEAKEFLKENVEKISAASMSGSVQKQLGELAKYRRQVIASPRLSTEQKDKLLEKLDAVQVKIARNFISVTDRTTRQ